jgi:demethylspheroidene O-methyltransferase
LFDLCGGFVYSQILFACVRLNLFGVLAEGPQSAAILAHRLSLPLDATRRLLQAATALNLVSTRSKDRFALGGLGAALLGNPGVAQMIAHHDMLYDDLRDPVALLREGKGAALARHWPYAGAGRPAAVEPEQASAYTALMSATQAIVADQVLSAFPLARYKRLLDIGGGDGAFVSAVAQRAPHLGLALFDIPAVAETARRRLAAEGLAERTEVHGGDFLADPLPTGSDIISLVRVIHDHDDEPALHILKAAHAALAPGGALLVAEPMAGTSGAETLGAYFSFYLLAMGSGRPRTSAELSSLMRQAGFGRIRNIRTTLPLIAGVTVAHK